MTAPQSQSNEPQSNMPQSDGPRLLAFAATHRDISANAELLARVSAIAARAGADVDMHDFTSFSMPVFAEEIPSHETLPEGGKRFLAALNEADGLLIASPEYNWSFPAALKNLIDWISCLRPNPFAGKTALLLGASPSRRGGLQGLLQLRVPLESLHVHVYPRYFALGEAPLALANPDSLTPAALEAELTEITNSFVHYTQNWARRR